MGNWWNSDVSGIFSTTIGNWLTAVAPTPPASPTYLWAWGKNTYGMLGLGDTVNRSSPVQVGALGTWAELATSTDSDTMFAVKTDGTLWSWGRAYFGKLGNGTSGGAAANMSSPIQVGALTNWAGSLTSASTSSGGTTIFIKSNGTMWLLGEIGGYFNNGNGAPKSTSPTQVSADKSWSNSACQASSWFGVTTGGQLWSNASDNRNGISGQNNVTDTSSPAQVGALTNWAGVYPGSTKGVIARKTDGTLWSWGKAYPDKPKAFLGQNNAFYARSSPVQIGVLTTWAKVIQTKYTVAAIKTDGTLWTWGYNSGGALGVGDTDNRSSPVQVGALTNWLSTSGKFATGQVVMMGAVKGDGSLWTWGRAYWGSLGQNTGQGTAVNKSSPTQVGALTTWTKVGLTKYATFAIGT